MHRHFGREVPLLLKRLCTPELDCFRRPGRNLVTPPVTVLGYLDNARPASAISPDPTLPQPLLSQPSIWPGANVLAHTPVRLRYAVNFTGANYGNTAQVLVPLALTEGPVRWSVVNNAQGQLQ